MGACQLGLVLRSMWPPSFGRHNLGQIETCYVPTANAPEPISIPQEIPIKNRAWKRRHELTRGPCNLTPIATSRAIEAPRAREASPSILAATLAQTDIVISVASSLAEQSNKTHGIDIATANDQSDARASQFLAEGSHQSRHRRRPCWLNSQFEVFREESHCAL